MWKALKDMFSSKKFLAGVTGVVVAGVAKLGVDLDDEAVLIIISPLMAYILGTGLQDFGKEKAKIAANGAPEDKPEG